MENFVYEMFETRVVFGPGCSRTIGEEVEKLVTKEGRALVVSTPGRQGAAEKIVEMLGKKAAALFSKAAMHVPIETAEAARQASLVAKADCIVAIGGGSTIGTAKAIALDQRLPILAIPTTYAGSEMSAVYGITSKERKETGRSRSVKPKTVIYDPVLSAGLPPRISAASGMNAIAHCVEGLYAEHPNPLTELLSEEGLWALADALPRCVVEPDNLEWRGRALYGAWLAGMVFNDAGSALHHRLCHVLGGAFGLPHAETHAILLPHVAAYNEPAARRRMMRLRRALAGGRRETDSAGAALFELGQRLGAPYALKRIGMKAENIPVAADLLCQSSFYNPRDITFDGIRKLLEDAFHGNRPDN